MVSRQWLHWIYSSTVKRRTEPQELKINNQTNNRIEMEVISQINYVLLVLIRTSMQMFQLEYFDFDLVFQDVKISQFFSLQTYFKSHFIDQKPRELYIICICIGKLAVTASQLGQLHTGAIFQVQLVQDCVRLCEVVRNCFSFSLCKIM